ncbi:MAG: GEVED domain-containing protein [Caldilineaceae bacterium]
MNSCTWHPHRPDWRALRRVCRLGSIGAAALMFAFALTMLITAFGQDAAIYAQTGPQLTVDIGLDGNPPSLQPGDIFTQRISLNYSGGAQIIDTFFTQQVPAGVRPVARPTVSETVSQTVTPLQVKRRGRTWGWQGKMRPDAELIVTFPLRVQQCYGADQTLTLDVSARRPDGADVTDSISVPVICPDVSIQDIAVNEEVIYVDDEVQAAALDSAAFSNAFYVPGIRSIVRFTLRNMGSGSVILGAETTTSWTGCLTCTVAASVYAADLSLAGDANFQHYLLDPGAAVTIDRPVRGSPPVTEPGEEGEQLWESDLIYCLSSSDDNTCPAPEQTPDLAALHKAQIRVRPNDLGDAPDSTNHAGAAMTAYAGTPAQFPTVFDPATGAEQGPRHVYPQFFHLGRRVSLEAEADIGPDQDPLNNILPAANSADNDRGDDGANPSAWTLQHCQKAIVPVSVFISPAAVNWFQQHDGKGYLNGWLDMNRNGDWADAFTCQDAAGAAQTAFEHLIIDHEIDVVALGAGLHTINVPTGVIVNNLAPVSDPAWVRLTLSERVSNKPLSSGSLSYGDGRGYARPFRTGETEDYLIRPAGHAEAGPDIDVQMRGSATEEYRDTADVSAAQVDSWVADFRVRFEIDYTNNGTSDANGALLEFQIPEKLLDGQIELLRAPGIANSSIKQLPGKIQFGLPDLRPGEFGAIVMGWTGCLTCTVASNVLAANVSAPLSSGPLESYDASVNVTLTGDVNPANNQATARVAGLTVGPLIGIKSKGDNLLRNGGMTCQESIQFAGRAAPDSQLVVTFQPLDAQCGAGLLGFCTGSLTETVQADVFGRWTLEQSLPNGRYRVSVGRNGGLANAAALDAMEMANAADASLYLLVDHSLLLDPMTFRMENASGRSFHVRTTNKLGNFEIQDLMLPPGDYTAYAYSCPNVVLDSVQFKIGDTTVDATQADDTCQPQGSDQCGPWNAQISVPGTAQAAALNAAQSLEIVAVAADSVDTFVGNVESGTGLLIRSVAGQAVANAATTLLEAFDALYAAWRGADYGQSNPQTTGSDGLVVFAPPAGAYRLSVAAEGYQPFLSDDIASTGGLLSGQVSLSPQITAAADFVVQITENGFEPAVLTVAPGSVVEFVNMDLADHTAAGAAWNSGVLTSGVSFKVQLDAEAVYGYSDALQPLHTGAIIVAQAPVVNENPKYFLPVAMR